MIFKTFDSKIDKWTSKIGIFGKSFNELGTAVNDAFKSVIDNLDNFDENVGFWESLKNNLFSKKDGDKDWIKNSLGKIISKENIDSYIEQLDLDTAKEKIASIFNHEKLVSQNKKSWEDYFITLDDGEDYIADLIKNTNDLSKLTGEDLVKANQQARASALAHNEAIKAQTLSAKAGKVALQALATVGNMIAMWAISKGIELAVKGIDNLAHSAEHCKERVDELMSNYKSTTSTLHDNAKAISEISDRYDQLSKGVGKLGNNISLTEEEFEEYHSITSKIAEMYPDLVDGWDAQGNAIVNLTDSVKELNAEYEKSLHNANLTLMESKDDIFKNYENTIIDITKDIEYAEKAMDIIQSGGSFYDLIYDAEGYKTSYYKAFENLGLSVDDMVNNNFNTLEKQITLKVQALKDKMEKAAQDVTPLLNAYLAEDTDYQNLSDEELKTSLSTFINSLPSSLVTAITENGASAGSNFVEGLVDAVKDDETAQNALKQLLTIDLDELSNEEARSLVDNYISSIVNTLKSVGYEIDPIELQVELGLDISNVKEDLKTRLQNGTQDLVINDWVENLTEEEAKLANSTAFDEALDRQKEKLNGAALSAENYSTALEEVKAQQSNMGTDETLVLFEDAWADSFTSEKDKVKELGNTLLDLAEKGRLTKEAFNEADSTAGDYFKNLCISADEAVSKINKLVDESKQLSFMSNQISSMVDALSTKLEDGFVSADTLSGFDVEIRGLDSWDRFQEVLGSTTSSYEECQEAANALATEWVNDSNFLEQLTEQNEEYYKTQLEVMGVENYEELISYAHALNEAKEVLSQSSLELGNATYDEIEALIAEGQYSELTANMILALYDAKIAEQAATLDTSADCEKLIALAGDADRTSQSIQLLIQLMNIYNGLESGVYDNNAFARTAALGVVTGIKAQLEALANGEVKNMEIEPTVKLGSKGKSSAKSAGKSAGDAYKDGLKEALSDIEGVISGVTKAIDKNISSIKTQKEIAVAAIDAQIDALNEQKSALEDQKKALEEERDARIEIIEQQKKQLELAIKAIDKQIKAKEKIIKSINDEIDAMKDANEQRKLQLNLQKEQYELERLQHQRTILVN